jgi:DNA-binding MarR family transcriptional regulator
MSEHGGEGNGAVAEHSVTTAYSAAHDAFRLAAWDAEIHPFDVRLLVALEERGGTGRTDELAREMLIEGTAIRRSSLTLRDRKLIVADAGEGTKRPKRGVRARLGLTDAGRAVAQAAIRGARSA